MKMTVAARTSGVFVWNPADFGEITPEEVVASPEKQLRQFVALVQQVEMIQQKKPISPIC